MKKLAEKSFYLQLYPINSSCVKLSKPFPAFAHLVPTSTQPSGLSDQFNYSSARLHLVLPSMPGRRLCSTLSGVTSCPGLPGIEVFCRTRDFQC